MIGYATPGDGRPLILTVIAGNEPLLLSVLAFLQI